MKAGWGIVLLAAAATACGLPPMVSDTGYAGSWRGGNDRIWSIVAIARSADGYRVKVTVRSADKKWETTCSWQGECEMGSADRKVFRYAVRSWVEPGSGRLRIEFDGKGIDDPAKIDHYVDEFVVGPGGLHMDGFTIERNGTVYAENARPKRTYTKIANSVGGAAHETAGR